jgi:predicted DNA-binding transcriptional regulator AlpA
LISGAFFAPKTFPLLDVHRGAMVLARATTRGQNYGGYILKPAPKADEKRFATLNDLIAMGLVDNRQTMTRLVLTEQMPPPFKIGGRNVWDYDDLEEFIAKQKAKRNNWAPLRHERLRDKNSQTRNPRP